MRRFHLLAYDVERDDLQAVCRYDVASFDTDAFRIGKPFMSELPTDVKLWVSDGGVSDYLPNPLSWPIVSDTFLDIIRRFSNDFELVPAHAFDVTSKRPILGYHILNVTRCIRAANLKESMVRHFSILGIEKLHVMKFVFDESMIPKSVHLFRPVESVNDVVVSDELAQAMAPLQGIALIATQSL